MNRINALTNHQPRPQRTSSLAALLLAGLLLAFPVDGVADPAAGRVISVVGDVVAIDADDIERALRRGDRVAPGDEIVVGPDANVQLRMRDDALIDLDTDSRFVIERYRHDADEPGLGEAVMGFLRGTVRTITGAIGRHRDDVYSIETPVATVGIRGTQYALQWCDEICAGAGRAEGLYGRVDEGTVAVDNDAALELFRERQYFYVADRETPPTEIDEPPAGILDGGAIGRGDPLGSPGDTAVLDADTGGLDALEPDDELTASLLQLGNDVLDAGGALLGTTDPLLETGDDLLGAGDDLLGTDLTDDISLADTTDDTLDLVDDSLDLIEDTLGGDDDIDLTDDNLIDDILADEDLLDELIDDEDDSLLDGL